jgi:hypothetical protein
MCICLSKYVESCLPPCPRVFKKDKVVEYCSNIFTRVVASGVAKGHGGKIDLMHGLKM